MPELSREHRTERIRRLSHILEAALGAGFLRSGNPSFVQRDGYIRMG
jgi:hypothetical protein